MSRDRSGISIATLGDLVDHRCQMWAFCRAMDCHHSLRLDLEALAVRLGRDFYPDYRDAAPQTPKRGKLPLRCTKCGSRNVTITISPIR